MKSSHQWFDYELFPHYDPDAAAAPCSKCHALIINTFEGRNGHVDWHNELEGPITISQLLGAK